MLRGGMLCWKGRRRELENRKGKRGRRMRS
jgi:hypothetical protein